eukprot:TRINITY_DN22361_c0_g1_i1.p1 TRINITY_DN22361_c0_g1~~TRINITY_DN22361_c0_g1_i1.p1  ORF type:complete len:320 (+),score=41.10 TRINITY_DN22361_c0_g1_i1:65-1024(+)
MLPKVSAEPYEFPLVGELEPAATCLLLLDFQQDWTTRGGFVNAAHDASVPFAGSIVPTASQVLRACRWRDLRIAHARRAFREDTSDASPLQQAIHLRYYGRGIGAPGPLGRVSVRGESGSEFDTLLKPVPGEPVVERSALSAFVGTDLDAILRSWGVSKLILCGACLDGSVLSTFRHAADLGFQNLLVFDCCSCEAPERRLPALVEEFRCLGGALGCVSDSGSLLSALGIPGGEQLVSRLGANVPAMRWGSPLPASLLTVPTLALKPSPKRAQGARAQTPGLQSQRTPRAPLPPRPATCDPRGRRDDPTAPGGGLGSRK